MENLSIMNKALLCKWSWQYANEKGAWWIEVIRRKYGEEEGGWVSCNPREGFGVGLWKSLRKWGYLVSDHFSYVVGDGKRTKFREGGGPLCIFWSVWKARNGIVFRDEVLSIQRLKSSFVYLFWLETKVYFVDGLTSLVHFFEGCCLLFGWLFIRG